MAISQNSSIGILPKNNFDYNKNCTKLREANNKFSMNNYGIFKQSNIATINKSNSNQSSINLNSSKKAATTYDLKGRNTNKNSAYRNSLDGLRQIAQGKFNLNGNGGIKNGQKTSPSVRVSRVMDISERDFNRLSTNTRRGPLASHVKESGVYKGKRYLVLDDVRYESKITSSERLNKKNFKWMRR